LYGASGDFEDTRLYWAAERRASNDFARQALDSGSPFAAA
jgi:hypothetical protein